MLVFDKAKKPLRAQFEKQQTHPHTLQVGLPTWTTAVPTPFFYVESHGLYQKFT